MNTHTEKSERKWFSKTRMNRYFLDEVIKRASRISEVKVNWIEKVTRQNGNGEVVLIRAEVENGNKQCYLVELSPRFRTMHCDCPDFKYRCSNHSKVFFPCKHIWAVIAALNRQN